MKSRLKHLSVCSVYIYIYISLAIITAAREYSFLSLSQLHECTFENRDFIHGYFIIVYTHLRNHGGTDNVDFIIFMFCN